MSELSIHSAYSGDVTPGEIHPNAGRFIESIPAGSSIVCLEVDEDVDDFYMDEDPYNEYVYDPEQKVEGPRFYKVLDSNGEYFWLHGRSENWR